jgi:hypothetical protein
MVIIMISGYMYHYNTLFFLINLSISTNKGIIYVIHIYHSEILEIFNISAK